MGCGTAYELSPSGGAWNFSLLYAFEDSSKGANPSGSLVFDGAGDLYGTTSAGGVLGTCLGLSGFCGTAFELTPATGGGWTETVVHSFGAYKGDGAYPAGLVIDSTGIMYGSAYGGLGVTGAVYEIVP